MVLIVDDKPENIFSLRVLLEIHKFTVDTAGSGEEALKKILKNAYSLIILDVQMPGMDGFEVAEAIGGFSKAKNIPIIFLSAVNIEKRFITKGYNSGGLDYVTKPFDPDILMLKVKTFHKLYRQSQELSQIDKALREEIEFKKKAENELLQRIQEMQSILEAIPHIAFTVQMNGRIEFVNEHWFRYSDRKEAFPDNHPADQEIISYWQKAVDTEAPVVAEIRLKKLYKNEYRYHLLILKPVIQDNSMIKVMGTLTDIQEQKTAADILEQKVAERTLELQQLNMELQHSNEDLQQFASIASHDLKEPLRKIQIYSSFLREKLVSTGADGFDYLERILNSSKRMTSLINDLLDYSTLSNNALFEETDLNQIVHDVLGDLEHNIQEKKASIKVGPLCTLHAVPGQIRQIFQNLLSNALKFSRQEVAPVIQVRSEIIAEKSFDAPATETGPYCRISITDNGIGFDEKYLERIFAIFQRLNSKNLFEGTGIGLAIVKRIVEKHNGIITAKSRVNEGSTFMLVLPFEQQNPATTVS